MATNQLFATKSLKDLLAEAEGDNRLKRVLGPVTLTALGVGAIIGAGIFVATGKAANETAGPALMLSYVVAGITCIFAALCYAEFASMAPVAGSAYTYAYCTMGELFAWIIGWDLVLEYAVGSATVANGWSSYFQEVLAKVGIVVPMALCGAPYTYDDGVIRPNVYAEFRRDAGHGEQTLRVTHKYVKVPVLKADGTPETDEHGKPRTAPKLSWAFADVSMPSLTEAERKVASLGAVGDPDVEKHFGAPQQARFNLPAGIIVLLVTAVLVKGISESAGFNALMVFIKVFAVLFVIVVGAFFINPENWTREFAPYGYGGFSFFGIPQLTFGRVNEGGEPVGVLAGAAIIFFAYIGFDSVSTHAEEAKNPQKDVPIGIVASLLICTVLYVAVVAVLTGMVPYNQIDKGAGVSSAFKAKGLYWAEVIIAVAGVAGITSVLLVMMLSGPRVFLAMARDGLVPRGFFAAVHPTFKTPWLSTIAIGIFVTLLAGFLPIDALLHLTNIGTLFAFAVVCGAVLIMRRTNPTANRPFKCPLVPIVPALGILLSLMLMMSLPVGNWLRLIGWLALGLVIYFGYGMHNSTLGKELRGHRPSGGDGIQPGPSSGIKK
jgi:APA family basic amino acid/polyamine antiporter